MSIAATVERRETMQTNNHDNREIIKYFPPVINSLVTLTDLSSCHHFRCVIKSLTRIRMEILNSSLYRFVHDQLFLPAHSQSWWYWLPFYQQNHVRIGFLGVDPEKPIPLHDHPNSRIALMVMSGHLKIQQFDAPKSIESNQSLLTLRNQSVKACKPGDVSLIMPVVGNIHGLCAFDHPATLLSIQLNASDSSKSTKERSWYFPLYPQSESNRDIWARRLQFNKETYYANA